MISLISTKKLVMLFVSGLIILSLTLSASDSRRGGREKGEQHGHNAMSVEQVEKMVVDMTTKLSLTEDQASKISELFKAHIAEVEALQKSKSGDRYIQKTELQKLRTDFEEKVNSILTADQQKLFAEMNTNCPEGRRGRKD